MRTQTYKNHTRISFAWHGIVALVILSVVVLSVINLVNANDKNTWLAITLVGVSASLIFLYLFTRRFALVAQDRAIRAEENFRHFVLTGKPLDRALRLNQIIALRFANDDEMPALASRAVRDNLSSRQIKESIINWRADHHRV
jgi:hypothetical protein